MKLEFFDFLNVEEIFGRHRQQMMQADCVSELSPLEYLNPDLMCIRSSIIWLTFWFIFGRGRRPSTSWSLERSVDQIPEADFCQGVPWGEGKSGKMYEKLTLYRPISRLLEDSKLAFALKEQYLNNHKRYHHDRHTVGKVFSLRIRWWKV